MKVILFLENIEQNYKLPFQLILFEFHFFFSAMNYWTGRKNWWLLLYCERYKVAGNAVIRLRVTFIINNANISDIYNDRVLQLHKHIQN